MVPEAVKQQAEEAEKALDDFEKAKAEQSPETEAPVVATQENMKDELQDQPVAEPEATPSDPTDLTEALTAELELEKQRSRTLQGRIDSQLAKANEENKELKTMMAKMSEDMEKLKTESQLPGPKRHLSKEEAAEMGDEVLGMQERIIKGTLEEELEQGQIKKFIEDLFAKSKAAQEAVPDSSAQAAMVDENLFWGALEHYYPGGREMNNSDQGWFDFLDAFDTQSGLRNRDIGAHAFANGDVTMLVDLMKAYKPAGHVEKSSAKPTIKPERSGAAPVIGNPQKPEFTKAEVESFYDDVARNKFKGTKEEALALENQIMEAAQDGRIKD